MEVYLWIPRPVHWVAEQLNAKRGVPHPPLDSGWANRERLTEWKEWCYSSNNGWLADWGYDALSIAFVEEFESYLDQLLIAASFEHIPAT